MEGGRLIGGRLIGGRLIEVGLYQSVSQSSFNREFVIYLFYPFHAQVVFFSGRVCMIFVLHL